jgi:hypothetical protein
VVGVAIVGGGLLLRRRGATGTDEEE